MNISLDDLYYFSMVAEYGGYSAASRAINVPKSRLSRRISALEESLQVSLINRSTRQFSLTDIGKAYLYYCNQMASAAQSAQHVVELQHSEPRGKISLACPSTLLNFLVTGMISRYLQQHRKVEFHIESTNREVNLIGEGFDLAIMRHSESLPNSNLVAKPLFSYHNILVASPEFLAHKKLSQKPAHFVTEPFLGSNNSLKLLNKQTEESHQFVKLNLQLQTEDMILVRRHALDGLGIGILPNFVVHKDLYAGRLVHLLPEWQSEEIHVSAIFSARNTLLPALRTFVDHLEQQFQLVSQQGVRETALTNGDSAACILIDED